MTKSILVHLAKIRLHALKWLFGIKLKILPLTFIFDVQCFSQPNEASFYNTYAKMQTILENEHEQEFINYFKKYMKKPEEWAGFGRRGSPVNVNMFIERLNRYYLIDPQVGGGRLEKELTKIF